MILYLIRHGQSANNLLAEQLKERPGPFPYETYMKQRVAEPPLTEMGERQANRLRNSFGDQAISRLYCSPMLRTMQTMQPVADALGTSPSVWLDLHEHGGIFHRPGTDAEAVGHPGLSRAEMSAKFPGYRLDGIGEEWVVARGRGGSGLLPCACGAGSRGFASDGQGIRRRRGNRRCQPRHLFGQPPQSSSWPASGQRNLL